MKNAGLYVDKRMPEKIITTLLLVGIAAVLQSAANLLLRGGILRHEKFSLTIDHMLMLAKEPIFVLGVLLYGVSALVWFHAISIADLTTAYPILAGLSFLLVGLGAAVFFDESVSLIKLVGMMTILVGIAVVARA